MSKRVKTYQKVSKKYQKRVKTCQKIVRGPMFRVKMCKNTSFLTLFLVIKIQYKKEKNKFLAKFGSLDSEKAAFAKSQSINKEILSNTSNI